MKGELNIHYYALHRSFHIAYKKLLLLQFLVALRVFVKLVSPAIIGYTCPPTWSYGIPGFRNVWPDAVSVLINISRFLDFWYRFKVGKLTVFMSGTFESGQREGSLTKKNSSRHSFNVPNLIGIFFELYIYIYKVSSYLRSTYESDQ